MPYVEYACEGRLLFRTETTETAQFVPRIHEIVVEIGRGSSHKLLESFAIAVLDRMFDELGGRRITVRVRKETPVLDGIVDSVGVQLTREGKSKP